MHGHAFAWHDSDSHDMECAYATFAYQLHQKREPEAIDKTVIASRQTLSGTLYAILARLCGSSDKPIQPASSTGGVTRAALDQTDQPFLATAGGCADAAASANPLVGT